MKAFVTICKDGIMIHAGVDVKSWLIKKFVTKCLFGIQVIVNANVINHAVLVSTKITKIVGA